MAKQEQTYTEEEVMMMQYENDIANAQIQRSQQNIPYSTAMFSEHQKQNLVEWQLDFKPELEAIERSLRNDILVKAKDGEEWITNPDPTKILLNDLGVSDILKKIILLINKNKVLSNYREEEIQRRLRYICHAVRELIYLNYEAYGMDNDYKYNCYYSLVIDLDDMIESAYRRAINGEERRDLNQARMVQQNDPMLPNGYQGYPMQTQKKGGSKLNPFNWFRG